jgi:hypothetical protein
MTIESLREIDWRALVAPPWRRYEIMTRLSPAEIADLMKKITRPNRWRQPKMSALFGVTAEPVSSKPFSGRITADGFIVSPRHPSYWGRVGRNSFVPVITGRFQPASGGTLIHITMRLNRVVLAFWVLWLAFCVWFLSTTLSHARDVLGNLTQALEILVGMPAFGYLLCTVSFDGEACWAKAKLDTLLSGDVYSAFG